MPNKNPLSYIKTETAEAVNKQTSELLQKDFRNVEPDIENDNGIEELKRKIDTITIYQKPYISKMLNKLLLENPINAEIICNYIVAEQNEINIKESTRDQDKKNHPSIKIL
jgi:hypothetical protein